MSAPAAAAAGPLRGRTALVTGASRGIGLAVAARLAEAGAWVGMVARTEPVLREAAEQAGGHALPADLSSPEQVARLAAELRETDRVPDLVVNSAGAFHLARLVDTEPAQFDRMLGANLRAPFLVLRALVPAMLERGAGHVINIGSVAGRVALPGNAAYGAAKFGLRGLHQVLVEELRGTGVRATLIEPAATDTPLWDPLDPDAREDLPSRNLMLAPDDVARAVLHAAVQPDGVELSLIAVRSIR